MADEFVDLYEVIDLPIDADRTVVRKRVNELYLEAQRNLDHRDFKTRVKYQEMFEITLPQARYILLDEGRRDDYDRIVRGIRAAKTGAPAPGGTTTPVKTTAFQIEGDSALPGQNTFEPIPSAAPVDPAKLAAERDELWKKWKSGLEEALQREKEEDDAPKTRTAQSSPVQSAPVQVASRAAPKPKTTIKFDFDSEEKQAEQAEANRPLLEGETRVDTKDREKRLQQQRLAITKDLLQTEAIKGATIGAASVVFPGVALAIFGMRRLYPLGAKPMIALPEGLSWAIAFGFIIVAAFFTSQAMSKSFRRKRAQKLSLLSNEELVKLAG